MISPSLLHDEDVFLFFFLSLYPAEYRHFFLVIPLFPSCTQLLPDILYTIYIYLSLRRGVSEIKTCSLSSPI